jgi:hypothetical protein
MKARGAGVKKQENLPYNRTVAVHVFTYLPITLMIYASFPPVFPRHVLTSPALPDGLSPGYEALPVFDVLQARFC